MLACAAASWLFDQVRNKPRRYQSNAIKHRVSACALNHNLGFSDQVWHKIHVCYREKEKRPAN